MAKANKKSGRKISVNMEGVQNFTLVPEGDYKIKIAEVTKETSDNSGNDYLAWTFEIAEGKFKGQKLFYNTSLVTKALWNLRGVLEAFGQEVPDAVMDLDLDELESVEEVAGCTVEHEKYEGKNRARIADIFSSENVGGSDDSESNGELPDDDAINAMDEDELKELIDELGLDVDPDDHKKLKALRKAVIEAVEEKRNGGGDDSEGSDKSENDLPSDEDVEAMDEDELKELIDELDLEVDPDEYKKLKALRNAVLEALEKKREGKEGDSGDQSDAVTEEAIGEMGKEELKAFVKEHKLKVELEGSTSKQRRAVIKAAKKEGLIEE